MAFMIQSRVPRDLCIMEGDVINGSAILPLVREDSSTCSTY